MKDVILLILFGFASGVGLSAAFGAKVKNSIANLFTKLAAKIEGK